MGSSHLLGAAVVGFLVCFPAQEASVYLDTFGVEGVNLLGESFDGVDRKVVNLLSFLEWGEGVLGFILLKTVDVAPTVHDGSIEGVESDLEFDALVEERVSLNTRVNGYLDLNAILSQMKQPRAVIHVNGLVKQVAVACFKHEATVSLESPQVRDVSVNNSALSGCVICDPVEGIALRQGVRGRAFNKVAYPA
jgi:hypothetical protein